MNNRGEHTEKLSWGIEGKFYESLCCEDIN